MRSLSSSQPSGWGNESGCGRRFLMMPAIAMPGITVMSPGIVSPEAMASAPGEMRRAGPPTAGYPCPAGPITRHPNIARGGARRCGHHYWRRINHRRDRCRGHIHRRRSGYRHHRDRWRGQIEEKAEANPGIGRQRCRPNESGQKKHFCFHNFKYFAFFPQGTRYFPRPFIGLYGAVGRILQEKN